MSFIHSHALDGQVLVITGTLPVLRKEAIEWILLAGGQYRDSVTTKTTILVQGTLCARNLDGLTRKLRRVRQLNERGANIMILTPEQFFNLITA